MIHMTKAQHIRNGYTLVPTAEFIKGSWFPKVVLKLRGETVGAQLFKAIPFNFKEDAEQAAVFAMAA
jgi:hypothetical protein